MNWETLHTIFAYLEMPLRVVTAICACQVTQHFLEPRRGWWNHLLLYIVHLCVMNAIVYVGDIWPPLLMVPAFVLAICILCRGKLIARISLSAILVLLPMSLNALLTNVPPPFGALLYADIAVLWGAILLFVRKALPKCARPPIRSTRLWALIDLLALMPFGTTFAVIAFTEQLHTYRSPDHFSDPTYIPNEQVLLIVLALAAIAALVLLVAVVVLARHEQLEAAQTLWQMRSQHYDSIELAQHQIRRLRHDMANHLTAMSGLDDEGMRRYLESLIASPALHAGQQLCENEIVNAVLTVKAAAVEEAGIQSTMDVRIPVGLPIEDMDLCALFANSLDNAIEANCKLPVDQRELTLRAAAENGFLMIELQNRRSGALRVKDGRIITSKQDTSRHGYGLAGIQEIAERYGGTCKVEPSESRFRLLVMIPVSVALSHP